MKQVKQFANFGVIIGIAFFIIGFAILGFNPSRLKKGGPYSKKNYMAKTQINRIRVESAEVNIKVETSEKDQISVTYNENDQVKYEISETDEGELVIKQRNKGELFFLNFDLNFAEKEELLIKVPKEYVGSLAINGDATIDVKELTGLTELELCTRDYGIKVNDLVVSGDMIMKSDGGTIIINDVVTDGGITAQTSDAKINCFHTSCEAMSAETSDSEVKMEEVQVNHKLNIETSCGGIELNNVTAPEALKADTSDQDIIFDRIQSDKIELWDSCGDISGNLEGKLVDYSITSKTSSDYENNLPSSMDGGDKILNVKTSDGRINVRFTKK